MMGSHQSKMSSSSERERAQALQVPSEQISTKPDFSSQPGAGVKPDQPNLQMMSEQAEKPVSEGRQSGEGLRSMAEAADEGTRGGLKQTERYATEGRQRGEGLRSMAEAAEGTQGGSKQTERYEDVPSMAEAAEPQPSTRSSQTQHGGDIPSVAEMAEPLVGGGEPVPSAGPAEGTAARSIAEQADADREQAQQQKYREEPEREQTAYREGRPEPVGGAGMGREGLQQTTNQQEPGVSEPLAFGGRPITQQRFVPDEQAKSGPQTYQRFERSGEPVAPSAPSEKKFGAGQTGTFKQQHPTGLAQGQAGKRDEEAGEPTAPSVPSERNLGFSPVAAFRQQQRRTDLSREQAGEHFKGYGESAEPSAPSEKEMGSGQVGAFEQQQRPTDLSRDQAGERFNGYGESAEPSAPSEKELGSGQIGAFDQKRPAGLAQGQSGTRTAESTARGSKQVPRPEPTRIVESQRKSQPGKEIPIAGDEEQAPRKPSEQQGPEYRQELTEEQPDRPPSATGPEQSGTGKPTQEEQVTTDIPVAGESEQFPKKLGEQQRRSSAPELQEVHERGTGFLGEQQANKLDVLISTVEPAPTSPERSSQPISGEERGQQPSNQGDIFYAQGEGYKGPEGRQQRPPDSKQQPQQQAFTQGEPSFGESNREKRLQQERLPDQTSAERGPSTGRFGSETASVQGEAIPISNMGGLTSEFAKMQFPREGFHERTEAPLKQEKGKQPGAASFETKNEVIGVGAESGRHVQYEYLPHPADIQFHSWGPTKLEAFGNMADCMFNYLANTGKVQIEPQYDFVFEVIGEDDKDLLYKFLDELLFRFSTRKQIICKRVDVKQITIDQDGLYRLYAVGHGEPYNAQKHESGTEIKAITLASLQVNEQPERTDAYVIVDI